MVRTDSRRAAADGSIPAVDTRSDEPNAGTSDAFAAMWTPRAAHSEERYERYRRMDGSSGGIRMKGGLVDVYLMISGRRPYSSCSARRRGKPTVLVDGKPPDGGSAEREFRLR
jgi:hypothetical protein